MIRDDPPWPLPPNRADIQALALRHVRQVYPDLPTQPGLFPIDEYLEIVLPREFDLVVGVLSQQGLPGGEAAVTLPGTDGGPIQVFLGERVYEALGRGDPVARFTAACHAAHVVLHAGRLEGAFVDGMTGGVTSRPGEPGAWVEVEGRPVGIHRSQSGRFPCPVASQARAYARGLLMNPAALAVALGGLDAPPDPREIARVFQVSFKDVWVRMREFDAGDQRDATRVAPRPSPDRGSDAPGWDRGWRDEGDPNSAATIARLDAVAREVRPISPRLPEPPHAGSTP